MSTSVGNHVVPTIVGNNFIDWKLDLVRSIEADK